MANPWFVAVTGTYRQYTLARGSDVQTDLEALGSAFDLLYSTGSDAAFPVGTAVADGDACQLSQMRDYVASYTASVLIAGGAPGDVDITDLGVGTATASELIRVNAAGTGIEGVDNSFNNMVAADFSYVNY